MRQPLDAAVKEGRLHYAAHSLPDGGVEGWWIPKYVVDANPTIKTIDDALKHPELFPSAENKGKGAVHNCPSGWNCQLTTGNAFKAWDAASKGFVLVDTGSAAGLDGSMAKAYERKQGWLGYYWAPTSILGKYEMVKLDAGVPHDKAAFEAHVAFLAGLYDRFGPAHEAATVAAPTGSHRDLARARAAGGNGAGGPALGSAGR